MNTLDRRVSTSARLRPWPAARTVLLVLLLAACAGGGSEADDDESENMESAAEKYVPEVDEGLGASVAIVIDNSGSMEDEAEGDDRPKYVVAREALEAMIATTDSFVAAQPGFTINVGIYRFSEDVVTLAPIKPYDREALRQALEAMPEPDGGTAIGRAMETARADLYRAGTFRKYILLVTDGRNTNGRSPRTVAREIFRRSEGAVRLYLVAFDVDAKNFDFLKDANGEVLEARNGIALRASLDTIYRGRILAEAMDAGETLPPSRPDSSSLYDSAKTTDSARSSTRPGNPTP